MVPHPQPSSQDVSAFTARDAPESRYPSIYLAKMEREQCEAYWKPPSHVECRQTHADPGAEKVPALRPTPLASESPRTR